MKPIDRKQELIAQAALHRQRMAQARQSLATGLQPGMLVKGIGGVALAALTLLRSKKPENAPAGIAALLPLAAPLALRGLSLLGRMKSPKLTARKLLVAGAVGAVAAFAAKKALAHRRAKAGKAQSNRGNGRK